MSKRSRPFRHRRTSGVTAPRSNAFIPWVSDTVRPKPNRSMVEKPAVMARRGHGRVMNLASIAAFQPIPALASYAASKAYVLSLTESLAEELRGSGVSVVTICPGYIRTPMTAVN